MVSEGNFTVAVPKPGTPGMTHTYSNGKRHRLVRPVKEFCRDEDWVTKAVDVCGFVFGAPEVSNNGRVRKHETGLALFFEVSYHAHPPRGNFFGSLARRWRSGSST